MLLLTLLLAATPQPASQFQWRVDRFANEFWILDNASAWDGNESNPFRRALESQAAIDPTAASALKSYADLRNAHSKSQQPDPTPATVTMLPPRSQAPERFAMAFMNAKDERAAAASLALSPLETEQLIRIFAALRPRLDALLGPLDVLQREDAALETAAVRARMPEFVDRMKHFYGVEDSAPYTVHILWAPAHYGKATVWDRDVILPLPPSLSAKPVELESWLGVVVHEIGHALLAQLGPPEAFDVSQRIIAAGTINQRHTNILDEACQAALGNIIFLRDRLPEALDRANIYSSDPSLEFPDAIDSLARALEARVSRALESGERFRGAFLDDALATQRSLFGNSPSHFAHVAMIVTGSHPVLSRFNGQFWGNDRFSYGVDDTAAFEEDSKSAPGISRWVVLTQAEATPELLAKLHLAVAAEVRLAPGQAACVRAASRAPGGGYDFFALGRDADGLRRLLIAVHRSRELPDRKALCVGDS